MMNSESARQTVLSFEVHCVCQSTWNHLVYDRSFAAFWDTEQQKVIEKKEAGEKGLTGRYCKRGKTLKSSVFAIVKGRG